MAKVTKERVTNICKHVNAGMKPSYAARAEGLGGGYLIALKNSGILYKDSDGNWKGMVKIHSSRYESFIKYRRKYDQAIVKSNYTNKDPKVITEKAGWFKRIWNAILRK